MSRPVTSDNPTIRAAFNELKQQLAVTELYLKDWEAHVKHLEQLVRGLEQAVAFEREREERTHDDDRQDAREA